MLPFEGKIRLLDVGSCYDPFRQFDDFTVVAIDISPAVEVFQCIYSAACYGLYKSVYYSKCSSARKLSEKRQDIVGIKVKIDGNYSGE
jgi:hypothetical protein